MQGMGKLIMITRETIDRLNIHAEALGATLTAYRETIEDIIDIKVVEDSLPDRWFAENIKSRGGLWTALTRKAFLFAESRAENIEVEKKDGKEEEYSRKRILMAIATTLLNFSNALVAARKELEQEEEGEEE